MAEPAATPGVLELDDATAPSGGDAAEEGATGRAGRVSRLGWSIGLAMLAVLLAVGGWLGFQQFASHQADRQRAEYLQAGRQGAINLTTVGWQTADADVQRILDSATGSFYDDFAKRAKSFAEVVKQAQSKSVGTIVDAGLESESNGEAQVLVAVTVETSNSAAAQQEPRRWRMRVSVRRTGDDVKVSNVAFVP